MKMKIGNCKEVDAAEIELTSRTPRYKQVSILSRSTRPIISARKSSNFLLAREAYDKVYLVFFRIYLGISPNETMMAPQCGLRQFYLTRNLPWQERRWREPVSVK